MHKKGNAMMGVIIAVVLVGGGIFVYSQQAGLFDSTSQATSSPSSDTSSKNEVASWKAAVEGDGSVTCDINPVENSLTKDGSLKVKSGQFLMKLVRKDDSVDYRLTKNDKTYIWDQGGDAGRVETGNQIYSGLERTVENSDQLPGNRDFQSVADVIRTEQYECQASQLSDSQFEIPENIEFEFN